MAVSANIPSPTDKNEKSRRRLVIWGRCFDFDTIWQILGIKFFPLNTAYVPTTSTFYKKSRAKDFSWRSFLVSCCWSDIRMNVLPPIEAGVSCFYKNSAAAPKNYGVLHTLHRRRFPCDPRYSMIFLYHSQSMHFASSQMFIAAV